MGNPSNAKIQGLGGMVKVGQILFIDFIRKHHFKNHVLVKIHIYKPFQNSCYPWLFTSPPQMFFKTFSPTQNVFEWEAPFLVRLSETKKTWSLGCWSLCWKVFFHVHCAWWVSDFLPSEIRSRCYWRVAWTGILRPELQLLRSQHLW